MLGNRLYIIIEACDLMSESDIIFTKDACIWYIVMLGSLGMASLAGVYTIPEMSDDVFIMPWVYSWTRRLRFSLLTTELCIGKQRKEVLGRVTYRFYWQYML